MSLNPDQHRALATTLRLLEERLAAIEDLLARSEVGILYRRDRAHLGRERQARIALTISELRAAIRSAAEAFSLAGRVSARSTPGGWRVTAPSIPAFEKRSIRRSRS